jgi:hypothetical protein
MVAESAAPPVEEKRQGRLITPAMQRSYSCALKSNLKSGHPPVGISE